MIPRLRIRCAKLIGLAILFLWTGCRTQKSVIQEPVVLENKSIQNDSARENHFERDIQQERSKEQIRENTTEKITVIITQTGDTLRTDREVITIRDSWLLIENLRLQARIDSLIFNQSLREKIEIPVPYPVEVTVGKKLSLWQQIRLKGFWVLAGILGVSEIYHNRKLIKSLLMWCKNIR